jgi:uncharacterized membrane protein
MSYLRSDPTATSLARGAPYDLVLLAHVLAALVGLGAVTVAGGYALALLRSGPGSDAVQRYYRPGINWAGRILFLVPVFGVVLIAMSHGEWSFWDGWVTIGLMLWVVAATIGELVLWPAERRLQVAVVDSTAAVDLRRACLQVMTMAAVVLVVLVVATVVMVAKP